MGHNKLNYFQLIGYPNWCDERPHAAKAVLHSSGSMSRDQERGGVLQANMAYAVEKDQAMATSTSTIGGDNKGYQT